MSRADDGGQLDWLVEVAGASVAAGSAAFAATKLAPAFGWPLSTAVLTGFATAFVGAFGLMRLIPAEHRQLPLPDFEKTMFYDDALFRELARDDALLSEELLLDQPLVEAEAEQVAVLILDDPLPAPAPDSRVVRLFADGRIPSPGQMKQRIDRHLADADRPLGTGGVPHDASDALGEALAELRRSLRQA